MLRGMQVCFPIVAMCVRKTNTSEVELSVVIVNYNNLDVLKQCVPTLTRELEGISADMILSDNGSTDGSLSWIRQNFPQIRVLENRENLGFAEGNNRALRLVRGSHVLLLNPDTIVMSNAIGPMIAHLGSYPRAGAVGCMLLAPNGSRQISARTFPTLLTYWLHFLGLDHRYPRSRFCGQHHMGHWDGRDPRAVDWVCGAALMVRRNVLNRVGGLDPGFFLTYDEVDWCRRIRDAGFEVWYVPQSHIIHLEGQSEPQSDYTPAGRTKYVAVERNSRVRYFVKHHGTLYACAVEVLHLVMCAAIVAKARFWGTRQTAADVMDKGLLLRVYWCAARRFPEVCWARLASLVGLSNGRDPCQLFPNPYTSDEC